MRFASKSYEISLALLDSRNSQGRIQTSLEAGVVNAVGVLQFSGQRICSDVLLLVGFSSAGTLATLVRKQWAMNDNHQIVISQLQ